MDLNTGFDDEYSVSDAHGISDALCNRMFIYQTVAYDYDITRDPKLVQFRNTLAVRVARFLFTMENTWT